VQIGARFQEETKYLAGVSPALKRRTGRRITVPDPDFSLGTGKDLWWLLKERRSRREFAPEPLALNEFSLLLWACQGVTLRVERFAFRAAPSAGALYPDDTYVVINSVEGMGKGVYLYLPEDHALEQIEEGDFRDRTVRAGLGQEMLGIGAASLIWSAVMERSLWKYRQRAYRYIYLDAGHICQNLYLACEALGLGCCGVAAFLDDAVNAIIGVDGVKETAIYMAAVGKA
jgi:SagB-type dehydrogenase family enzyme